MTHDLIADNPPGLDNSGERTGTQPRQKQLKWKKISKAILQSTEDCCLPIKAFKARAWEVARAKGATNRKEAMQEVLTILENSKQFTIDGSTVLLS